jgi:hypothetical protein
MFGEEKKRKRKIKKGVVLHSGTISVCPRCLLVMINTRTHFYAGNCGA